MCSNEHGVKVPSIRPSVESSARVFVGTDANTGKRVRIPAVQIFCSGYENKGCGHIDYYPVGSASDIKKMCHYCLKELSQKRTQKGLDVLNNLF